MRYLTQIVTLKDGRQITGMLAEETANSITLKLGASIEVILRTQIEKSEAGTRSLMPDGLENLLNPQQMADVLAWIRAR
jgi:putative heme-binding domain-containing protein